MLATHYIVLSSTIEPSNGMIYAIGFIGLFNDLQKALDAGNAELQDMNVPDYYYLIPGRETTIVTVDQNGKYVDEVDDSDFSIKIDIIKARQNHIYSNDERVV